MNDIDFCIDYLKRYNGIRETAITDRYDLLRALMNITMPINLSEEYYQHQDNALQDRLSQKMIVDVMTIHPEERISVYKGDITLLKADAIVNACNEKLLGCFSPLHGCIDNAIHSYAGLQVRRDMMKAMEEQGHDEANGQCKVSKAYNLPSQYIFHTVGPIVNGYITERNKADLSSCYLSCLEKADEMKLKSIVFCSISTGVYGYPIDKASEIAFRTVKEYLKNNDSGLKKIIFDVFSERDYEIYHRTTEKSI